MSCGAGRRLGSELALLWLWCRPATAALIQPLAWELPYATDVALKRQKNKEYFRSSCCAAAETSPNRNHEVLGSISGLAQWVKDLVLP